MRFLLVGGAPIELSYLKSRIDEGFERIIAADGGAQGLLELGVMPHILLGDFDSLSSEDLKQFQDATQIRAFPEEKDWTDMELAVDTAIHEGASSLTILGGIGERWDHTLANIGLLYRAEQEGIPAVLEAPGQQIRLLSPGQEYQMNREEGSEFSLIPMSKEVRGVRAWGVKFPLENGTLRWGETLGIHNCIRARTAHVVSGNGFLILIRFQSEGFEKIK